MKVVICWFFFLKLLLRLVLPALQRLSVLVIYLWRIFKIFWYAIYSVYCLDGSDRLGCLQTLYILDYIFHITQNLILVVYKGLREYLLDCNNICADFALVLSVIGVLILLKLAWLYRIPLFQGLLSLHLLL